MRPVTEPMWIANNTEESIMAHLTWLIGAAVAGFLVAYLLALPRNLFVVGHRLLVWRIGFVSVLFLIGVLGVFLWARN